MYNQTPSVEVGLMADTTLAFAFNAGYVNAESGNTFTGLHHACLRDGKVAFMGGLYDSLLFEPAVPDASFDLEDVTIGIDFHWQRKESQRFRGALRIVVHAGAIVAINRVEVEEYLLSVISSEMSATASAEFLKAHAVISRSWLLAQIANRSENLSTTHSTGSSTDDELIRWYDREDHDIFDVCADDHCQRYQGVTRASTPLVGEVIRATNGEILVSEGRICDTRFSKCCGGVTERFENVWQPQPHTYLTALRDGRTATYPDLTAEHEAAAWIDASPEAFCNTADKDILSQVLNNYDRETTDFFRWEVEYTREEISALIRRKSGMDFGDIIDLVPLKRGTSGRIEKLKIVGTRLTYTIGKELEIRRTLSESHLYSSAFVVIPEPAGSLPPSLFRLKGAGWGHGVGLCQIGAAVMGAQGYDYRRILTHYFPGAVIEKRY
jgi:SpoIID/LytB domain protein